MNAGFFRIRMGGIRGRYQFREKRRHKMHKMNVVVANSRIKSVVSVPPGVPVDWLKLVSDLGGYYSCPKDQAGKRLGPLVGYAGRYGPEKNRRSATII